MRNGYGGTCYRCGQYVAPGAGHFEKYAGGWRVQHAECAIEHRGTDKVSADWRTEERGYRARRQAAEQQAKAAAYFEEPKS